LLLGALAHWGDALRTAKDQAGVRNQDTRLFVLPNAEVLRLETQDAIVRRIVIALHDPFDADDLRKARVVRLDLKPGALVVLAGNTINSTRLALNSFPRPKGLAPGAELIGRNLMAHVRGNWFWRIERSALNVPPELPNELETAALHVRGNIKTTSGKTGQFHFQFYATPNLADDADYPEQFLYQMVPNIEDIQTILESQRAGKIVVGIRNTGETFGDKTHTVGSDSTVGWVSVDPFGGSGDDVYLDNGQELRIPKVFVNLVETKEDKEVRDAQNRAAFAFVAALAGQQEADAHDTSGTKPIQFLEKRRDGSRVSGDDDPGTTYHEAGTMWMGTDYTSSVTDVNGRFHHVANAYCADQATFPSVGSANPVNTGMALTRMVARSIIARFDSTKEAPLEPGFTRLYNGNYAADGWQFAGSKFNGVTPFFDKPDNDPHIIGAGLEDPGFDSVLGVLWFSKRTFKDFELRLDWRAFDPRANSGIFLRAPQPTTLDDANFYNSAIEVQIDERGFRFDPPNSFAGSPLHKTGAVYAVFPARQWAARVVGPRGTPFTGLWNTLQVVLKGADIRVALNGRLVSEGTFAALQPAGAANAPNPDHTRKRTDGYIGLQSHTEVVQFRNIRIKEL
jgi:hypothetical protein